MRRLKTTNHNDSSEGVGGKQPTGTIPLSPLSHLMDLGQNSWVLVEILTYSSP